VSPKLTINRCLTLARSHALLSNPKNSLALLALASQKLKSPSSSSEMDTSDDSTPPNITITPAQLSSLSTLLTAETNRYRALVELSNLTSTHQKQETGKNWKPLIERLNDYDNEVDGKNLVVYPPKLEVAPVKPLFFDAAWNYIKYSGEEREEEKEVVKKKVEDVKKVEERPATPTAQKKGWFGFGR